MAAHPATAMASHPAVSLTSHSVVSMTSHPAASMALHSSSFASHQAASMALHPAAASIASAQVYGSHMPPIVHDIVRAPAMTMPGMHIERQHYRPMLSQASAMQHAQSLQHTAATLRAQAAASSHTISTIRPETVPRQMLPLQATPPMSSCAAMQRLEPQMLSPDFNVGLLRPPLISYPSTVPSALCVPAQSVPFTDTPPSSSDTVSNPDNQSPSSQISSTALTASDSRPLVATVQHLLSGAGPATDVKLAACSSVEQQATPCGTPAAVSPPPSPTSTIHSSQTQSPLACTSPDSRNSDTAVERGAGSGSTEPARSDTGSKESSPTYSGSVNPNGPTSMDSADSGVSLGMSASDKKDTSNGSVENSHGESTADEAGTLSAGLASQELKLGSEANVDKLNVVHTTVKMPYPNSMNHISSTVERTKISENHTDASVNEVGHSQECVKTASANIASSAKNITVAYAMSTEQQPERLLDINELVLKTNPKKPDDLPFLVRPYSKGHSLDGADNEKRGKSTFHSSIDQSLNWMGRSDLNPGGDDGKGRMQLGKRPPFSATAAANGEDELTLWIGGKYQSDKLLQNNNKPSRSTKQLAKLASSSEGVNILQESETAAQSDKNAKSTDKG